jgi:hypothetical protein
MMNELIRQLADQCRFERQGINCEVLDQGFDEEKFAKLLVKEATNIVLHYTDVDEGVSVAKKHFGLDK